MLLPDFLQDPKFASKLKNRVLLLLRRRVVPWRRPALLGELSLESKMSLNQTREVLQVLIDDGVVRECSEEECNRFPNTHVGYAFTLVMPTKVPLGDLE